MAQTNRITMITAIALWGTGAQMHIRHMIRWSVDNGCIILVVNRFYYRFNWTSNYNCYDIEFELAVYIRYRWYRLIRFKYRSWKYDVQKIVFIKNLEAIMVSIVLFVFWFSKQSKRWNGNLLIWESQTRTFTICRYLN